MPSSLKSERTPQEKGFDFEDAFAKALGVKPQPGSGSVWWAKLDVYDTQILWSLKHTTKETFKITRGLISEVVRNVFSFGGVGPSTIPGVAVALEHDDVYVVLRAEDFMRLVTEQRQYVAASKDSAKRATARLPALLRDDEDEA
jgi:hypothetical protein